MNDPCLKFLSVGTGPAARRIAVRVREGAAPGLFWLGGFKSDMRGTKAEALDQWARDHGRAMTRFDYSGHGESGGNFTDGTIGRWLEESLAVFDACCRGAQICWHGNSRDAPPCRASHRWCWSLPPSTSQRN
jgi:hypothetical protein